MALTITKEQRDALYDQILDRLSGIGDIELTIQAENFGIAKRLASEYSDDLRLLNDLGFGDGHGEPVELTAPPEVLRRVLPRMRDLAERNRLVAEACEAVLADIDSAGAGGR